MSNTVAFLSNDFRNRGHSLAQILEPFAGFRVAFQIRKRQFSTLLDLDATSIASTPRSLTKEFSSLRALIKFSRMKPEDERTSWNRL
jgi:hypothetical protein